MRTAAALLKEDLKAGKEPVVVDEFQIKFPEVNSHQFHTTEGKVCVSVGSIMLYIAKKTRRISYEC